jgi:drug/metabolite transporter (DMT)-like permease
MLYTRFLRRAFLPVRNHQGSPIVVLLDPVALTRYSIGSMIDSNLGEVAALGTAILWSVSYVYFTIAVRRIGTPLLNRARLTLALGLLVIAHTVVHGTPLPFAAEASRWGWLVPSGVIGFAISDALMFRSLWHLGAHRTSILMALIPLVSALLAWVTLGEKLAVLQIVGALLVVGGIALVVSSRAQGSGAKSRGQRVSFGVLCALGAVLTQSLRYILSKHGMMGGFPILSTSVIQIFAATVAVWLMAALGGRIAGSFAPLRDRTAALSTIAGSIAGPFFGVNFSLVALAAAPVGIASTLMAMPPVFLLPISYFVFKERITLRAIIGTGLAVGGTAWLFLV